MHVIRGADIDETVRFSRGEGRRGKIGGFLLETILPETKFWREKTKRWRRQKRSYSPYGELRRLPD